MPIGVRKNPQVAILRLTLTHVSGAPTWYEVEYDPGEAVDTGHDITGWMGQTLKRDNSELRRTLRPTLMRCQRNEMDGATFYTNIDPAKPGKLEDIRRRRNARTHRCGGDRG